MLKLYSYFRSSASYRVRIALHWKGLEFDYLPIHLLKDGGQQHQAEYRKINPMGHVPALDHDGFLVAESMAIVRYLEQKFPEKSLWPKEAKSEARFLQVCELINSGIQPLQNLKVLSYLEKDLRVSPEACKEWTRHWIHDGLSNLEKILAPMGTPFCMGADFTAADCFLLPQCFASRRFGIKIEDYPTIARIEKAGLQLPAVQRAHPEQQPDFVGS